MDKAWYDGAALAALDLHFHLMSHLVRRGLMSQADIVEVLDDCLHDIEQREASVSETERLEALHTRAHVEALLRTARAGLAAVPRPR